MSNPYFDWPAFAGRFAPFTKAKSEDVNAALDLVSYGFDLMVFKAPLASPEFTGTPKAPTPLISDLDTSRIATIGYVLNAIGSTGSMLPPQAGHATHILTTDGVSATWQPGFPAEAGNAGRFLTTNGTSRSWADIVGLGLGGIATYNASATHAGAQRILDLRNAAGGTVVQLPDATTLPPGTAYWVHGSGLVTGTAGIADSSGELLDVPPAAAPEILWLTGNGTAAGTWQRGLGTDGYLMRSLPAARSVLGASTTIASGWTHAQAAAVSGQPGVYLVAGTAGASSGLKLQLITVSGNSVSATGATITVGTATIVWMKLLVTSSGFAVIYSTGSALFAVGVTVAGSVITSSAATSVVASHTATTSGANVAAGVQGDFVVVVYGGNGSTTIYATGVFFTGSSPTVGSQNNLLVQTHDGGLSVDCVGAGVTNKFVVAVSRSQTVGPNYSTTAMVLTYSNVNSIGGSGQVTMQTGTYNIGGYYCQVKLLSLGDAVRYLLVARQLAGSSAVSGEIGAAIVSVVSNTPTANANVDLYGGASGTHGTSEVGRLDAAAVGSYFYVGASDAGAGMGQCISISGNVITRVGSVFAAPSGGQSQYAVGVANGYAVVPTGSGYTLNTLDASGITTVMTVTDTYAHAAPSGVLAGGSMSVFKQASGKRLLSVSPGSALMSRVTQYGGIA